MTNPMFCRDYICKLLYRAYEMGRRSFSSVDNVMIKIGPKSQKIVICMHARRCYLWWKYIHFAAQKQSIIIIIILSVSTDCV